MAGDGAAGHSGFVKRVHMAAQRHWIGHPFARSQGRPKPFQIKVIRLNSGSSQALFDQAKIEESVNLRRNLRNARHSANDTIFANLFGSKLLYPEGAASAG